MHTVRHLAAQRLGIALLFITLAWPGSDLPAQADAPIDLEIPAGRLATALNRLVDESGLQIVYDARLTEGLQSRRVSGRYTPEGALRELLADTDLDYRVRERGTVILERAAQASPPPEPLAQATPPPEPEEEVVTLPAITVTASPYDDTSYNVLDASTATKTDTPIMETPVSIQVVPRAVIEDQQAIRLEDALKNVSGVVTGFGFGGLEDTFIIRGFENSTNSWNVTEVYRDGALVVEGLFSLADVERVEVLKGPAAMLYGRLQPGGLINVVTKRPQSQAGYSLEQQFGSFDTYRTTLNATGPVTGDGSLAYRVDFEYLDQDSFRDFAFNEQVFVSPKLTWRISDRTQIDAEYVYFDQDSIVDGGLPVIGNRVANIPRERFLQEPTDRYSNEFQGGGLALTHSVTDNWKFQGKFFKYAATYATDSQVSPTSLDEATGILTRNVFDSEHVYDSIFGMANLTGKFSTWALDHTLLFGADYYDSGFDEDGVFLSAADGVAPINIFNPIYGQGVLTSAGVPNNSSFHIEDSWYGIYIQDQIRFGEQWHLLVGGRYDDASSSQSFTADRSDFAEDSDSEFTPRVGLLYHPVQWLSLYGSYVEGYHHANIGRTTDGTDLEPERSRQYEAGVKGEWWDGRLTSTLTYYHLTKRDITVGHPDPALAVQGFVEQTGEARSRGIEFDVHGQLSDDWSLIGSYGYTDVVVTEDQGLDAFGNLTSGNKGHRLQNVPRHAGSLWIQHKFLEFGWPGLSAGFGVFLASEREGDLANSFQLPGYARLDAALKYSQKVGSSKLTVQFNVNNLLDEDYFVAADDRTSVTPAEPLTFLGSIRLEF